MSTDRKDCRDLMIAITAVAVHIDNRRSAATQIHSRANTRASKAIKVVIVFVIVRVVRKSMVK